MIDGGIMRINNSSLYAFTLSAAICVIAGCTEPKTNGSDENPVCTIGTKRCVDNNVKVCQDNAWTTLIPCSSTQRCDPSSYTCTDNLIHVCDEGETKCDGTAPNQVAKYCDQNAWHDRETCTGKICDGTTGTCIEPQCTPGVTCNGNTLVTCLPNGTKTEKDCTPGGNVCDVSKQDCVSPNTDKTCTLDDGTKLNDGQSICMNDGLVTCTNGIPSGPEDCTQEGYICHDGASECAALKDCDIGTMHLHSGEYGCNAEGNVVLCDDGDASNVQERCTGDKVCMLVSGHYTCQKPADGSCTFNLSTIPDGGYICDGNVLKKCESGTMSVGSDCASNHNGKSLCQVNACVAAPCNSGAVASGSKICNDDNTQIMVCTDGVLAPATGSEACTSNQYCQPGTVPTCHDNVTIKQYNTIQAIHADYDAITSLNANGCVNDNGDSRMTRADVSLTGVVTATKSNGFFIQDPDSTDGKHAGIMVHCINSNCTKSGFPETGIKVDDNVQVTASYVGYRNCQLWVRGKTDNSNSVQVQKTNGDKHITATKVTINDINTGVHNDYNGTLVHVEQASVASCDTNGASFCKIKDTNANEVYVTNYIAQGMVNKLKNMSASTVFDVVGIVYFYKDKTASSLGASLINKYECTGTEKKCENNALYTCASGHWPETGTPCTTDVLNAVPVCNANGKDCSYECAEGFIPQPDGSCLPPEPEKQNCTDVNGATVLHGDRGCESQTVRARCDDGSWTDEVSCPTDPNGSTTCQNNTCALACNEGYELNETSDGCNIKNLCDDAYGNHFEIGDTTCVDDQNLGTCDNGRWSKTQCESGKCYVAGSMCVPPPLTWCIFKHVESDGSAAYVRFLEPANTTVTAQFACHLKNESGHSASTISNWTFVNAFDATSGCTQCGNNKEYKTTSLPMDEGQYDCVAILSVVGGKRYVCPKTDIGSSGTPLTEYNNNTNATDADNREILVKWDFNKDSTEPSDGVLKDMATFELANSTNSLNYKNHTNKQDRAVYTNGWPSQVVFSMSPYYHVRLNTRGYKDIKISFDTSVSTVNSTSSGLMVGYRTNASNYVNAGISLVYTTTSFRTIQPTLLPLDADNAGTLDIGIFPSSSKTSTTISLDNLQITGVRTN